MDKSKFGYTFLDSRPHTLINPFVPSNGRNTLFCWNEFNCNDRIYNRL